MLLIQLASLHEKASNTCTSFRHGSMSLNVKIYTNICRGLYLCQKSTEYQYLRFVVLNKAFVNGTLRSRSCDVATSMRSIPLAFLSLCFFNMRIDSSSEGFHTWTRLTICLIAQPGNAATSNIPWADWSWNATFVAWHHSIAYSIARMARRLQSIHETSVNLWFSERSAYLDWTSWCLFISKHVKKQIWNLHYLSV